MSQRWLQIRGDPSIRQFLFNQIRVDNEFDSRLDEVLEKVRLLLVERGIFHAKIHFSSGQVTLWSLRDPYRYLVTLKEEFLSPCFESAFDKARYSTNAVVAPHNIDRVLDVFRKLRRNDNSIYLRSGSLNLMNGTVGLNFSCDGSHYIDHQEFIEQGKDIYD